MGPLFAVVLAVSAAEAQPCPKRTLRLYASWALQGDRSQETFDWRQQDQRPLLTKIRDSGADLVYLGAAVETGLLSSSVSWWKPTSLPRVCASWAPTACFRTHC